MYMYQIKPTCGTYVLHNLQGQSGILHFLILRLNTERDSMVLNSFGNLFQSWAPKNLNELVP